MQTFKVDGMTCGHCERAVTGAVNTVDAAAKVSIDRAAGIVAVDSSAAADQLIAAIEREGYQARRVSVQEVPA